MQRLLSLFLKRLLRICILSQIKNSTNRTLDVVFSRFNCFSFTITLRQKPKEVTRVLSCNSRSMRVTPLGFCLRIIVNEKPLNLEKKTFSVLSVLLLFHALYIYYISTGLIRKNVTSDSDTTLQDIFSTFTCMYLSVPNILFNIITMFKADGKIKSLD